MVHNPISNKVPVSFNMFSPLMKDKIIVNADSCLIVTIYHYMLAVENTYLM